MQVHSQVSSILRGHHIKVDRQSQLSSQHTETVWTCQQQSAALKKKISSNQQQ